MKKISVAAFLALILLACTREKEDDPNQPFLGAWKLDKIVEEDYHPVHTLLSRDEDLGKEGDSVIFKANGAVFTYSDEGRIEEDEWELMTDSTLRIEYEIYKIMKLTDREFYLREEDIDQALDEKWVYELYLRR